MFRTGILHIQIACYWNSPQNSCVRCTHIDKKSMINSWLPIFHGCILDWFTRVCLLTRCVFSWLFSRQMNSSLSKLLQILKNHFLQAYLEAVTTRLVIVIAILPPTTCAKVIYVNFSVHHVPSIYVYSSQWKKDSIF